jgi:hypothetical protein
MKFFFELKKEETVSMLNQICFMKFRMEKRKKKDKKESNKMGNKAKGRIKI